MKQFSSLILLVSISMVSFSNAAPSTKRGQADENTRIQNKTFSVEIAKGWYFEDLGTSELKPTAWEDKKVTRYSMGEVLATPVKESDKSPVYLSVHYFTPSHQPPKDAKITIEKWQGREWTLAQYWSRTSPDGGKTWQEFGNYFATTPYEKGAIVILAGAPRDEIDNYRSVFLKMMASVKVNE